MKQLQSEAAIKVVAGVARKADFEALGVDNVRALKSDREQPQYRPIERAAKKDDTDEEERTFTWVASSEHVDSMGDIIRVPGWDLTRVKTGVAHLLLGHDPYPLPAGLIQRGNKSAKCDDGVKCLELTGRIFEPEIFGSSDFGQHVEGARKLIARGDLKGCSVGFVPLEGGFRWPNEEERAEFAMPPWGGIFESQELLELSITPIPAQRNARRKKDLRGALDQLVADGQLDKAAAEVLLEDLVVSESAWLRRMESLSKLVVPVSHVLPWARGAKAPESDPSEIGTPVVADAVARIERAAQEALATVAREARTLIRSEVSAVAREILEPLEDAITEAADDIRDAATHLGAGRKDSDRAEVRKPSGSHEPDAASAVSTATSRDNQPTTPAPSRAGELLLRALDPAYAGADTAHAPDRSSEAGSLQGRR